MKTCFEIKENILTSVAAQTASICVFSAPEQKEIQEITETLGIDRYDLDSALDPDEISRVEFAPDRISIIWKQPKQVSVDEALRFDVSSAGLFLDQFSRLIMISADDILPIPFPVKEFQKVGSPTDVLLRYLFYTTRHYLGHLKAIKQITADLESKISSSMENRYLLQMFALSESLTYYLTSIEANGSALLKLASKAERLGFSKQQIDFLDDIVLENKQCARQALIYGTVLSGLMDARGTIINNNMNVLLKNLTLINIVFLPLNLIASIGGMSEYSVMTQGMNWKVSYTIFSLAMVLIGWLTYFFLVRYIDKGQRVPPAKKRSLRRIAGLSGKRSSKDL
jgi:magnesium transporter